ncbi:VanZ family protein [Peribacillus psychrosaccharolyticus]|nr:VanZ family protein [Peribacillus psychrosaccharolyticus]MEC2056137.1 VanZ family protein [Peribacillus psychrosaccharolyticus]MED3745578.1 VanZ family protein [Peribacillus psychrosaccharolyticus]
MTKQQKIKKGYLIILFCLYLAGLVYFMFFGFGRSDLAETQEYRYWLIPDRIPLWVPRSFSIETIKLWIFALGNLLAFVPFGILVPMVFKKMNSFIRFIFLFVIFIFCMEILQMVTYLGSFDATDIMVNTMGAAIGFCSYKISERMKTSRTKRVSMGVTIVGLSLVSFFIAKIFNDKVTPYIENIFGLL